MRCLCGAPDCWSCGPAQGVAKCELHDKLACDDCLELKGLNNFIDSYSSDLKSLSEIQNPQELREEILKLIIEMLGSLKKL